MGFSRACPHLGWYKDTFCAFGVRDSHSSIAASFPQGHGSHMMQTAKASKNIVMTGGNGTVTRCLQSRPLQGLVASMKRIALPFAMDMHFVRSTTVMMAATGAADGRIHVQAHTLQLIAEHIVSIDE